MRNQNKHLGAISPTVYRARILLYLRQRKSPMLIEEIVDKIMADYGDQFGEVDLRRLKGKKLPVWQNFVAHALASLTKKRLILTGIYEGDKYVVLRDPIYETLLYEKKKITYRRKCTECGQMVRMKSKCDVCGAIYNPIPQRQIGE